jgi:hypothetical protein
MAHFASDSAIPVPAGSALEKSIQDCQSVSEIQNVLHAEAARLRLIEPDGFDPEGKNYYGFHPVEPGTAPRRFAKAFLVNGKKVILESDSEEGLVQEEIKAMHQIFDSAPAARTQADIEAEAAPIADLEQPRNEKGQFITYDPAITALAPTVAAALEAQGISVDDLREFSQNKKGEAYQQSWSDAVTEFQQGAGKMWPGGERNLQTAQELILASPELMDNPDKVAVLTAVFEHMQTHSMVAPNEEIDLQNRVNAAQTPDELRAVLGYRDPSSSGLWGR